MIVLAVDPGLTCGWAALGDGLKAPLSGSVKLNGTSRTMGAVMRQFDAFLRDRILQVRPTIMCFATPFVGSVCVRGRWQPVSTDTIRPLIGLTCKIEEVAEELHIRCAEFEEPDARRAFLSKVPRKSKDIKAAIVQACGLRGWVAETHHAADALCIASYCIEQLEPGRSHEMTPLFIAPGAKRSVPRTK